MAKFDYLLYRLDSSETLIVNEKGGKWLVERSPKIKEKTINEVKGIMPMEREPVAEFPTWKEARDYAHAMLMKSAE